jgi:hypothetical protein
LDLSEQPADAHRLREAELVRQVAR